MAKNDDFNGDLCQVDAAHDGDDVTDGLCQVDSGHDDNSPGLLTAHNCFATLPCDTPEMKQKLSGPLLYSKVLLQCRS